MNNVAEISEKDWIVRLLQESKRDLVFLWHIADSRFGGPKYSASELPGALTRVTNELIAQGCVVGFGDPDSSEWEISADLLALASPGEVIAAGWFNEREKYEFLVFSSSRKK